MADHAPSNVAQYSENSLADIFHSCKSAEEILDEIRNITHSEWQENCLPKWTPPSGLIVMEITKKVINRKDTRYCCDLIAFLDVYTCSGKIEKADPIVTCYLQFSKFAKTIARSKVSTSELIPLLQCIYKLFQSLLKNHKGAILSYFPEVFEAFLDSVVDSTVNYGLRRLCIEELNDLLRVANPEDRAVFKNSFPSKIKILCDTLRVAGHYEFQTSIVEAIIHMSTIAERTRSVSKWFPGMDCTVHSLFTTISDFDPDCRRFLNAYNTFLGRCRLVYTFPCLSAFIGKLQLIKPKIQAYQKFWIDFNTVCSSISFFYHLEDSTPDETWQTMNIYKDNIETVTLYRSIHSFKLVFVLKEKEESPLFNSTLQKEDYNLLSDTVTLDFECSEQLQRAADLLFEENLKIISQEPEVSKSRKRQEKSTESSSSDFKKRRKSIVNIPIGILASHTQDILKKPLEKSIDNYGLSSTIAFGRKISVSETKVLLYTDDACSTSCFQNSPRNTTKRIKTSISTTSVDAQKTLYSEENTRNTKSSIVTAPLEDIKDRSLDENIGNHCYEESNSALDTYLPTQDADLLNQAMDSYNEQQKLESSFESDKEVVPCSLSTQEKESLKVDVDLKHKKQSLQPYVKLVPLELTDVLYETGKAVHGNPRIIKVSPVKGKISADQEDREKSNKRQEVFSANYRKYYQRDSTLSAKEQPDSKFQSHRKCSRESDPLAKNGNKRKKTKGASPKSKKSPSPRLIYSPLQFSSSKQTLAGSSLHDQTSTMKESLHDVCETPSASSACGKAIDQEIAVLVEKKDALNEDVQGLLPCTTETNIMVRSGQDTLEHNELVGIASNTGAVRLESNDVRDHATEKKARQIGLLSKTSDIKNNIQRDELHSAGVLTMETKPEKTDHLSSPLNEFILNAHSENQSAAKMESKNVLQRKEETISTTSTAQHTATSDMAKSSQCNQVSNLTSKDPDTLIKQKQTWPDTPRPASVQGTHMPPSQDSFIPESPWTIASDKENIISPILFNLSVEEGQLLPPVSYDKKAENSEKIILVEHKSKLGIYTKNKQTKSPEDASNKNVRVVDKTTSVCDKDDIVDNNLEVVCEKQSMESSIENITDNMNYCEIGKSPSKALISTVKILADYPIKPTGLKTPSKLLSPQYEYSKSALDDKSKTHPGKHKRSQYPVLPGRSKSTSPAISSQNLDNTSVKSKKKLFDPFSEFMLDETPPESACITNITAYENNRKADRCPKSKKNRVVGRKNAPQKSKQEEAEEKSESVIQLNEDKSNHSDSVHPKYSHRKKSTSKKKSEHTSERSLTSMEAKNTGGTVYSKYKKKRKLSNESNAGGFLEYPEIKDTSPPKHSVYSDLDSSEVETDHSWFHKKQKRGIIVSHTYKNRSRSRSIGRVSSEEEWAPFKPRKRKSQIQTETHPSFSNNEKQTDKPCKQRRQRSCQKQVCYEEISLDSDTSNDIMENLKDNTKNSNNREKSSWQTQVGNRVESPELLRNTSCSSLDSGPATMLDFKLSAKMKDRDLKFQKIHSDVADSFGFSSQEEDCPNPEFPVGRRTRKSVEDTEIKDILKRILPQQEKLYRTSTDPELMINLCDSQSIPQAPNNTPVSADVDDNSHLFAADSAASQDDLFERPEMEHTDVLKDDQQPNCLDVTQTFDLEEISVIDKNGRMPNAIGGPLQSTLILEPEGSTVNQARFSYVSEADNSYVCHTEKHSSTRINSTEDNARSKNDSPFIESGISPKLNLDESLCEDSNYDDIRNMIPQYPESTTDEGSPSWPDKTYPKGLISEKAPQTESNLVPDTLKSHEFSPHASTSMPIPSMELYNKEDLLACGPVECHSSVTFSNSKKLLQKEGISEVFDELSELKSQTRLSSDTTSKLGVLEELHGKACEGTSRSIPTPEHQKDVQHTPKRLVPRSLFGSSDLADLGVAVDPSVKFTLDILNVLKAPMRNASSAMNSVVKALEEAEQMLTKRLNIS